MMGLSYTTPFMSLRVVSVTSYYKTLFDLLYHTIFKASLSQVLCKPEITIFFVCLPKMEMPSYFNYMLLKYLEEMAERL